MPGGPYSLGLSQDGMLIHHGVTTSMKSAATHFVHLGREKRWTQSEHNTVTPAMAQPGLLQLKSSSLTIRQHGSTFRKNLGASCPQVFSCNRHFLIPKEKASRIYILKFKMLKLIIDY